MSNRLGALAVVALVLLAGCSGGLTGDGGSPDDAAATTGQTDAATTEAVAEISAQPWATADEQVDFETLREVHADALANASTYAFETARSSEDGTSSESRIAVDRDADRVLFTATVTEGDSDQSQATYVSGDSLYSRTGADGEFTYDQQNATDGEVEGLVTEQSSLGPTGGVAEALEWEYVGAEDGQYRFEADSIAASEETSFDADNATESTGTLVVDETGYIAEFSMSLTIATAEGEESASLSYATSGVGDTTVEEPSWVEQAAESSSS